MTSILVNLRLERVQDGRTKVVWGDGSAFYPRYHLVSAWISEKATAARAALEMLGAAYLQPIPNYDAALAEVARCGHELRRALFEDCIPEDSANAAEVRRWFDEVVQGPATITVSADASLPLPWGALHETGPGLGEIYDGFWAPRFRVAAVYNGMRALSGRRVPVEAKLLAGLNQQIYCQVHDALEGALQDPITALLDRPVGRAFTVKGCRERWKEVGESDCVIYFFGHATGEALLFSEEPDGRLSVNAFRNLFRRESAVVRGQTPLQRTLTVLNGCLSSAGQDAESFLLATADPGFYGFVGAEARVPDRFGLLFGHDLLRALLGGQTVRDAMAGLWRQHRPLGLLYGCYAHPGFAIMQAGCDS